MDRDEKEAHFAAMNPLVNALFDVSEEKLDSSPQFLPYGAALLDGGEMQFLDLGGDDPNLMQNPRAVVPAIKEGLADKSGEADCIAIGLSEMVMIGDDRQVAVKVQVEHRSGFAMNFYLPFDPSKSGEDRFGEMIRNHADRELGNWGA